MEQKLNVGDKVTLIRDYGIFKKGEELTIIEVDPSDEKMTYKVSLSGRSSNWLFTQDLVPVAQTRTTSAFKVGDRVRVIDHRPSNTGGFCWNLQMDAYLGKEGVVESVEGSIKVRFPDGDYWYYKPSWLIPVSSASKPEPPFKAGDRVRLRPGTPNLPLYGLGRMGQTFTVEKYDESDNTVKADGFWWCPYMLEHVEPESRPLLCRAPSSLSASTASLIASMFASRQPQMASNLPLINSTKLLTHIKLD